MPTLYDNFSQVKQYIDQEIPDMSTYVSKSELSNAGYITSIPNTYASYTGVYSYLNSIGITRKENGGSFIDLAYITDSELSGDIWINGISPSQLPTYTAISEMGYVTSADLPVIDENIIPKETSTYTLGDADHIYRYAYIQTLRGLGSGFSLMIGTDPKYDFYSSTFRPRTNGNINLGGDQYKWGSTYTSNLYAGNLYLNDNNVLYNKTQYQVNLKLNGGDRYVFRTNHLSPASDAGSDLGQSDLHWNNAYINNAYISNSTYLPVNTYWYDGTSYHWIGDLFN